MTRPVPHRSAFVLAGPPAVPPPGIDGRAFARACLADSYEVLADLEQVSAGIVLAASDTDRPEPIEELLWPGDRSVLASADELTDLRRLASRIQDSIAIDDPAAVVGELLLIPADVPDLPGLVLAKVARALGRAEVCTAPEIGGDGLVAFGVRLPWPSWLDLRLDLDHDPQDALVDLAPRRSALARAAGWHRMRRPESVHRLDPGLEGWDQVRLLLGG